MSNVYEMYVVFKDLDMSYRPAHISAVKIITVLISIIMSAVIFTGCSRKITNDPITRTGFYFDTVIQITLYDESKVSCIDECFALAEKYENLLSPTVENSDLWNINHSDGNPVAVSDETAALLHTALSYCELTGGRIDITIEPVNGLWDFHTNKEANIPSDADIEEALTHVDYHALQIEGNTVTLTDPKAEITLGFIAKGYIADRMKEYLLSRDVKNAIIDLGGNLLAVGSKPDGTAFSFGVQNPFDAHGTPITVLSVYDRSLVSSGVYERCFYLNDKLYHHILNTSTGYPIENNLLGVTVLSDSSTVGDALSTTCFVLGAEEGMALIESLDDTEAIFIYSDYHMEYSSGLASGKTF